MMVEISSSRIVDKFLDQLRMQFQELNVSLIEEKEDGGLSSLRWRNDGELLLFDGCLFFRIEGSGTFTLKIFAALQIANESIEKKLYFTSGSIPLVEEADELPPYLSIRDSAEVLSKYYGIEFFV